MFWSIARGEATATSDIDLAVVVSGGDWDHVTVELSDVIRRRLGNECDVVIIDAQRLVSPIDSDDPLIASLLRDAVALAGEDVSAVARAGVGA